MLKFAVGLLTILFGVGVLIGLLFTLIVYPDMFLTTIAILMIVACSYDVGSYLIR